ncbi:MAG: hypothetical protein ACRDFB_05655 [Rhabdochlamydiaceae bacterium]
MIVTSVSRGVVSTQKESDRFRFSYLKQTSFFYHQLSPTLKTSDLTKILTNKGLCCEVLLEHEKPQGWFIYKTKLQDDYKDFKNKKIFVVKLFHHNNMETTSIKICNEMIKARLVTQAQRLDANGILIRILSSSPALPSLLQLDFKVISDKPLQVQQLIYMNLPKQALDEEIKTGLSQRDIKQTESKSEVPLKRKREEDKDVKPTKMGLKKIKGNQSHQLPMKGTLYFNYIINGQKKFEGRVNGAVCQRMHVGDHLRLFDRFAGWGIKCEITSKHNYSTFKAMLEEKGVLQMLPQLEEKSNSLTSAQLIEAGVKIYQDFPGAQRVNDHGATAIGIKFLEKI